MNKLLVLLGLSALLTTAVASDKGNGGHVLVCEDSNGSLILKAYDQGHSFGTRSLDLGDEKLNFREKVLFAAERLEKYNPLLAQVIKDEIAGLEKSAEFRHPDDMVQRDWPTVIGRENASRCEIAQFAVNFSIGTPGPSYHINKAVWDLADENTKAVVVIHEIIYRYFRSMVDRFGPGRFAKPEDLVKQIRVYTSVIISDVLNTATFARHQSSLRGWGYNLSKMSSTARKNAFIVGAQARWEGFPQGTCGDHDILLKGSEYVLKSDASKTGIVTEDTCLDNKWRVSPFGERVILYDL